MGWLITKNKIVTKNKGLLELIWGTCIPQSSDIISLIFMSKNQPGIQRSLGSHSPLVNSDS